MTDRENTDWIRGNKDWLIMVEAPEGIKDFRYTSEEEALQAWKLVQESFAWASRVTGRDFTLLLLDQQRDEVERVVWDQEWREWMDEADRVDARQRAGIRLRERRNGKR